MTIEELKQHCVRQITEFERIKEIMPVTPNDYKRYEEHKLILELIEALEQQPCEDLVSRECNNCAYYVNGANDEACDGCFADEYEHPNFKPKAQHCEDAVSRQAVLDIVNNPLNIRLADIIKALPPVKQEPKTVLYSGDGYADGYLVYDMAECPNCGYEYEDGDKDWGLPFCPNCGQSLNWESENEE